MNRLIRTACLVAVLGVVNSAWAQDAEPTAEQIRAAAEAFDDGKAAFRDGIYTEAAEHFEKADQSAPSPAALELALRARERAGQLDRAATLAALALTRHGDNPQLAQLAQGVLQKANSELHKVQVTCDVPCTLVVDTKVVHGRAASERQVYLYPGEYVLRAGFEGGGSASEKVSASAGGTSAVEFTEPPPEPEPTAGGTTPSDPGADAQFDTGGQAPSKGGWSPAVFWTGVGLTALAGGVTVWSGLDTVNNPGEDRVREECAGQGEDCSLYQDGRSKQTRTNVLIGVTAGVGLATILIGAFATDWSGGQAEKASDAGTSGRWRVGRIRVEPWLDLGNGATVGASGRF